MGMAQNKSAQFDEILGRIDMWFLEGALSIDPPFLTRIKAACWKRLIDPLFGALYRLGWTSRIPTDEISADDIVS